MVHYQLDALGVGIFIESLEVEVRIRGYEVEDVVLLAAEPVLPAFVPSFDQEGVESVRCGEVDVAPDVVVVGSVAAVRGGLGIVADPEFNGREVIGIGPVGLAGDHLPPYSHILDRMYPGNVVQCARFVEVQDEPGSQRLAGIVHHHNRTPRSLARSLDVSLPALCVRSKPGSEYEAFVVQVEAGCRIVHDGCFMDIDVQAVVGLQLE